MRDILLAASPIAWSNDDMPEMGGKNTFEQCVSEIALAGYDGCEIGHKFPREAGRLREALELRGLRVCNSWFSYCFSTHPVEKIEREFISFCKYLRELRATAIGGGEVGNSCHGLPEASVFERKGHYDEGLWKKASGALNRLGRIAREEYGLRLCFHHHMGTAVQTAGEVDRLLDSTDPESVSLNYDSGHFLFAGEDPVAMWRRYQTRIGHIHLKDGRRPVMDRVKAEGKSFLWAVAEGCFTVPGDPEGSIDWDGFFGALKESDYSGWLVVEAEQNPDLADPLQYALLARRFLRRHLDLPVRRNLWDGGNEN